MPTLLELRDQLRQRQDAAKAAGLAPVLGHVDLILGLAVTNAISLLDEALAAHAAAPDLSQQHAAIVESLDADPKPKAPIAPLRKPPVPLGAQPVLRTPPAPRVMSPRVPRKVTGPDKFDLEIPF